MSEVDITGIMKRLQEPFPSTEIEWRCQRAGVSKNGTPWAYVLAYVQNRAIQRRLDDLFGVDGWHNQFQEWRGKGVLCGISIRIGLDWITKWDGAEETDIEPTKGGLSDSMKRAAVQFGIGRYLYNLEENFAVCSLEARKGWRMYRGKDGQTFYWMPPELPDWAIPEAEREERRKNGNGAKREEMPKPNVGQGEVDKGASALQEDNKKKIAWFEAEGISRGMLVDAFGVAPESFGLNDWEIVKAAYRAMKQTPGKDFPTAYAEVVR